MKNTLITTVTILAIMFSHFTYSQNKALDFDGLGDYIRTGFNGIPGGASRSVQCWYKGSFSSQQQFFVDMGGLTGTGSRFSFKTNTNVLRIEIGGGGLNGSTNIRDNAWHQLTVTYDSAATTNKYKLYVDGVLDAQGDITVATPNTPATSSSPVTLGIRTDLSPSTDLNGELDEVRIWSKVLTPAEISANYNTELCGTSAGLVAYFKMNEGAAGGTNTSITSLVDEVNPTNTNILTGFSRTGSSSNWIAGTSLSGGATIVNTNTISACGSYTMPNGTVITVAGTYYDTLPSSAPCDSLDMYTITFPPAIIINTVTDTSCLTYTTPMGRVINITGTYFDTVSIGSGCDTTIQYDITISGAVDDSVYRVGGRITSYDTWADHQWIRCDSNNLPIAGETNRFIDVTSPGDYAVIVTRGSCIDTSDCVSINPSSISENSINNDFEIYPNPTTAELNINNMEDRIITNITLIDVSGKMVMNTRSLGNSTLNVQSLENGVYFIKIETENGTALKRFVKQ